MGLFVSFWLQVKLSFFFFFYPMDLILTVKKLGNRSQTDPSVPLFAT